MSYSFEPKPDITAFEVAEILKVIGLNAQQSGINKLSPETRRHFEKRAWYNPASFGTTDGVA